MILLILLDELSNYKSREPIPLSCEYCSALFYKAKNCVQTSIKGATPKLATWCKYCSRTCAAKALTKEIYISCTLCKTIIARTPSELINSSNYFCSQSCAATYNNQHKTWGTRRSKLEVYLEQQLKSYYPTLPCLCNNKEAVGSELDFYFPTLRLAVELNGILHYEPIYGPDKLERIQDNDSQKSIRCYEQGIEFCSIDSSTCGNLTQANKDKYWNILDNLLKQVIQRV